MQSWFAQEISQKILLLWTKCLSHHWPRNQLGMRGDNSKVCAYGHDKSCLLRIREVEGEGCTCNKLFEKDICGINIPLAACVQNLVYLHRMRLIAHLTIDGCVTLWVRACLGHRLRPAQSRLHFNFTLTLSLIIQQANKHRRPWTHWRR